MSPEVEIQNGAVQSEFVERVVKIPVVQSAWAFASSGYEQIKHSSDLVNFTCSIVENSISFTAEQAKPVLQILEKPIHVADSVACNGLAVLENRLPLLVKQPEEILDTTKKMYHSALQTGFSSYEDVKKMGLDKLQNLTDYGVAKVQTFVDEACLSLVTSTEAAISTTEDYVNYYLPPSDDETEAADDGVDKDFVARVESISNKAKDRMYRRAMKRLNYLQKRSESAIETVRKVTDLVKNANGTQTKETLTGVVGSLQDKATWLWDELNKEERVKEEDGTEPKSAEQQILQIARRATKQLVQTYTTYSATLHNLPQTLQERLAESRQHAVDLYNHFAQVATLKEISAAILNRIQEKISFLQTTAASFLNFISNANLEDILKFTKESQKPEEIEMMPVTDSTHETS